MATIKTREVGLTSVNRPLTNAEVDTNFINLNTDISLRVLSTEKGAANGVATLGADGKVPSAQLPSYVDDVLEFTNLAGFPTTGESGKIYVALDANKTYRWSGSAYVYITSGAVDSVAGKTGVVTLVKADVGLSNVDNTSDANKPVSTATQTALNTKLDSASYTASNVLSKIKTVDGSGSGLDADLLDGLDSSSFVQTAKITSSTELDNMNLRPGFYNVEITDLIPGYTADHYFVQHLGQWSGGGHSIQVAYPYTSNSTNYYFIRKANNTTWGAWAKCITEVSDGAGSGLDADLLDGLHAASTNTASTVVSRDASGNFAAGTIAAALTGNASTATKLATARTINGVAFDGSANISVNATAPIVTVYIDAVNGLDTNAGTSAAPIKTFLRLRDFVSYGCDINIILKSDVNVNYGESITFDNARVAFNGKGFTLSNDIIAPNTTSATINFSGMSTCSINCNLRLSYTQPSNITYSGCFFNVNEDATLFMDIGADPSTDFNIEANYPIVGSRGSLQLALKRIATLSGTYTGANAGTNLIRNYGSQNPYYIYISSIVANTHTTLTHIPTATSVVYVPSVFSTFDGNKYWHGGNDGSGSGLDADLLDGIDSTGFTRNFGSVTINPAGSNANCTTAQFITWLTNLGAFNFKASVMKCSWDYAGNNDISDTGFGQLDLAGCIVETFGDLRSYIIRVTSPSTGTGSGGIHEYVNHGSDYSPGWRRVYTSSLNGDIAGNAAGLTGLTATVAELNYVDGVTSNVQTQLNAKAPLASPALTGTPTAPTAAVGTNTTQIATTAFVMAATINGGTY